jgi:HemY protein
VKFGILVVLALLVSVIAANALLTDPGYVAISIRGYLIEMSVPVMLLVLALLLAAIWFAAKLLAAPRRIGEAAGRYRAGRAGQKMTAGMIEMAEGNYAKGEKLLARAANTSATPVFSYLQAARAAHLQGEDKRRDEWLNMAYEHSPDAANAILLTRAEFQIDRGQHEQALATLRQVEENSGDHSHTLALLGRLYYRLEDWEELGKILPQIEKQGRVDRETVDNWSIRVYGEAMQQAADSNELDAAWKKVPRRLKDNLELLETWIDGLVRIGDSKRAEKELVSLLKKNWRAPLVERYGLVEGADASRQLKQAEDWLSRHADDPDLLLATARLSLRNELWGKARSYFETVISLRPSPEVYREYGHLLNHLGEGDAAAEAFREGLGMVSTTPLPQIPHLKPDAT